MIYCLLSIMLLVLKNANLKHLSEFFPLKLFLPFQWRFCLWCPQWDPRGSNPSKALLSCRWQPYCTSGKKKILNLCTDYKRLILKYWSSKKKRGSRSTLSNLHAYVKRTLQYSCAWPVLVSVWYVTFQQLVVCQPLGWPRPCSSPHSGRTPPSAAVQQCYHSTNI